MKQSAVEWLESEMLKPNLSMKDILEQAKEMEKQQQSYSEEEVEILLETLSKVLVYQGNDYRLPHYFEYEIKQIIEQFKNK